MVDSCNDQFGDLPDASTDVPSYNFYRPTHPLPQRIMNGSVRGSREALEG